MDFRQLPVYAMLPEIKECVSSSGGCILRAAPGAGKTMLLPVALSELFSKRILLMEPRRIAAKAAAAGIAAMQRWTLGSEVGYAVRGESVLSSSTRIVAATCGVVLNMLQNDPELNDYDAVIFDEFHERGAEQELIFALLNEVRSCLRPELAVVIMSATLDEELSARLPEFPEINVPGREFPVEICYREISREFYQLPAETARAVISMFNSTSGDMLVFLPGKNEIDRCGAMLENSLDNCVIMKLHGSMPLAGQSRVLFPLTDGRRKVVLATNIAESSLTIEGITVVVDSGWERRMNFSPGMGIPALEPARIALDSACQRSGRAGRCAPGKALRLWSLQEELGFLSRRQPEISRCDLSRTVLELARWGADAAQLEWLTPPPESGIDRAEKLLVSLGLLDKDKRLTPAGKRASLLPVHPRLGAMLIYAETAGVLPLACEAAAFIEEGRNGGANGKHGCDLAGYLAAFRRDPGKFPQIKQSCRRLKSYFKVPAGTSAAEMEAELGVLLARAYPEYIGRAKKRHSAVYQLSGGRSAKIGEDDPLRHEEFLAIADLTVLPGGDAAVYLAAPLSLEDIRKHFSDVFTGYDELQFDETSGKVSGVHQVKLGSIVLESSPIVPDKQQLASIVLQTALRRGLDIFGKAPAARRLLERVRFARRAGDEDFPAWEEEELNNILKSDAPVYFSGVKDFNTLQSQDWLNILKSMLGFSLLDTLNRICPDKYRTPAGQEIAIDYSGEQPTLSVPIPQLFGETVHPCVGKNRIPLRLELLSPARRPVQITCDLPGFWKGSWHLVRTELRSRYPKHEWPEHPEDASACRSSVKKR